MHDHKKLCHVEVMPSLFVPHSFRHSPRLLIGCSGGVPAALATVQASTAGYSYEQDNRHDAGLRIEHPSSPFLKAKEKKGSKNSFGRQSIQKRRA